MAVFPTAAVDRLKEYNSNAYDPSTNPFGMALGGHRQNFPQATVDVATVGDFIEETATEVDGFAGAASSSATAAENARSLAQRWAANPEDVVVSGGLFSARHYAAKAQASAAAAATFDPSSFYNRGQADARFYTKADIDAAQWATAQIADGAVTGLKLANLAVATGKLADKAVTVAKFQDMPTRTALARMSAGSGPGALVPVSDLSDMPRLANYTTAMINGLTVIIFDVDAGFVGADIICSNLTTATATNLAIQFGPAGQSPVTTNYITNIIQSASNSSAITIANEPAASAFSAGGLGPFAGNQMRASISFGVGGSWTALSQSLFVFEVHTYQSLRVCRNGNPSDGRRIVIYPTNGGTFTGGSIQIFGRRS